MADNEDNRVSLSTNGCSAENELQIEMVKGGDESGSVNKGQSVAVGADRFGHGLKSSARKKSEWVMTVGCRSMGDRLLEMSGSMTIRDG